MKDYSEEFKESMLKKTYNSNKSIYQLAQDEGIPPSTLYSWKRRKKDPHMPSHLPSSTLTLHQKFQIVLETQNLKSTELNQFLRKKGLYSHHLEQFKKEISSSFKDSKKSKKDPYKKEVKLLKKELHRKEKALAEASALLLLKKKLEDYYREEEEENTH